MPSQEYITYIIIYHIKIKRVIRIIQKPLLLVTPVAVNRTAASNILLIRTRAHVTEREVLSCFSLRSQNTVGNTLEGIYFNEYLDADHVGIRKLFSQ